MSDIGSALVGAAAALTSSYVANFWAEEYRRFRDGSTLAAALAGELASHGEAVPKLFQIIDSSIEMIKAGNRPILRSMIDLKDHVFEDGIGKLGLLGPALAENVVFAYHNIRAFRLAFKIIADFPDMPLPEFQVRYAGCRAALERAQQRGQPAVAALRQRAEEPFRGWTRLWNLVRGGKPM
jgi:hypothetical protein